jgi:hypothetical protein
VAPYPFAQVRACSPGAEQPPELPLPVPLLPARPGLEPEQLALAELSQAPEQLAPA